MNKKYIMTWKNYDWKKIDQIRDPVYESYIPVREFLQIYEPLLYTLDGRDLSSYIDFFFRPSPVNKGILEFCDEDARLDFRDFAEEMGLIAKLEEIMEGEDSKDKLKRKQEEKEVELQKKKEQEENRMRSQAIQKEKQMQKAKEKAAKGIDARSEQLLKQIDKLIKALEGETEPEERDKIKIKLDKAMALSQKTN